MKQGVTILFFLFMCLFKALAQDMTAEEYVQKYKDLAIEEMKRMGVPAAITLAQGLLETQDGNSDLLKESNNHFGIKCKSTWTADVVYHDDDARGECFRKYKSAEDSYRDHSNFLRGSSRYAFLFKLDPSDYKGWAYGLRKAGYATNPRYPEILIKNIEDNHLEQYTDEALNEVPRFDDAKFVDDPDSSSNTVQIDPQPGVATDVTINGSKALLVPKGTSLLAIATNHNIKLEKLLSFNDLSTDGLLQKDQYVFLEKKQKEGAQDFCIARPGETLYDIAQQYGVILDDLYSYNRLSPDDYVVAGKKIYLKPQEELTQVAPPVETPAKFRNDIGKASRDRLIHTVRPGENLFAIARKYDITVSDLKKWNHLHDAGLQIGQQLIILR